VEPVPQRFITFILKHRNLQIKLKAENLSTKKTSDCLDHFPFSGETIQTASCVFVTFVLFSKNAHSCGHALRFFWNFICP